MTAFWRKEIIRISSLPLNLLQRSLGPVDYARQDHSSDRIISIFRPAQCLKLCLKACPSHHNLKLRG